MSVARLHMQVGPRVIWVPCDTFYDAHTLARVISTTGEADVDVYVGAVRTHVYIRGVGTQTAKVELVN